MGMRAKPTFSANLSSPAPARVGPSAEDDQALGPEDALVMVLFPKASWDAVVALAGDMGVEPPEALGEALLLLRARVDAAKKGG